MRGPNQRGQRVLRLLASFGTAFPLIALSPVASTTAQAKTPTKPNIVFILTDDQRWDSLDQMPQLDAAPEWARFSNAYVDEPQCCPSRASILTGRYPQHTGVETLRDGSDMNNNSVPGLAGSGASTKNDRQGAR